MKSNPLTFLCCLLVTASQVHASSDAHTILQKVANASGLASFDRVALLDFTFKAEIGDREIIRAWSWAPENERVTYSPGSPDAIQYDRADVSSDTELQDVDQKFINDLYWLIFPFNVAWDPSVDLAIIPQGAFTAGIEAAGGLRVAYPAGVGYTPGDVYEIYYDEAYLVSAWVFRKGGSATPSRITSWENYQEVGPLKLSLDRPAPSGDFRISFQDVRVELK